MMDIYIDTKWNITGFHISNIRIIKLGNVFRKMLEDIPRKQTIYNTIEILLGGLHICQEFGGGGALFAPKRRLQNLGNV